MFSKSDKLNTTFLLIQITMGRNTPSVKRGCVAKCDHKMMPSNRFFQVDNRIDGSLVPHAVSKLSWHQARKFWFHVSLLRFFPTQYVQYLTKYVVGTIRITAFIVCSVLSIVFFLEIYTDDSLKFIFSSNKKLCIAIMFGIAAITCSVSFYFHQKSVSMIKEVCEAIADVLMISLLNHNIFPCIQTIAFFIYSRWLFSDPVSFELRKAEKEILLPSFTSPTT